MITSMSTLVAGCAALAVAVAPAAQASGGPGGGGAGGGGQTPAANCQIKQLSDTPVLFATSTAIDTTYSLTGCAGATWGLTYVNTARGTTDFTAAGTTAAGLGQGTVEAGPLPFNYPYRVTLTVTDQTGSILATRSGTLFTPKPRD